MTKQPSHSRTIQGAGLGLRRSLLPSLEQEIPPEIEFFELAPENWLGNQGIIGGRLGRQLAQMNEQRPIIAHGLSLSVGGPAPLDMDLLAGVKQLLDHYHMPIYSEHLSYTADGGQLYDLLPLPFTDEAVQYVSQRIRQVQDYLQRRIAIENVSYYWLPEQAMSEVEFVNAVLAEADCELLLDVNNVYVNSRNHGFDPHQYLQQLAPTQVRYIHVAGHYVEDDGFIIDTHGADVINPVWQLLDEAYARFGALPTLLERDFNLPQLDELTAELSQIKQQQARFPAPSKTEASQYVAA